MKKSVITAILLILTLIAPGIFAVYANESRLTQLEGIHPRIFLDASGFSTLKAQIEGNTKTNTLWTRFLSGLGAKIAVEPPDYREDTNTEDLWMRDVGDTIGDMAFAYRITGDTLYFTEATKWVEKVAAYPSWGRGSYENKDLACAHLLTGISLYYDWMYDKLSENESQRVFTLNLLQEKGALMRSSSVWYSQAFLQNHLWIAMSSLIVTAAAIYDEAPATEEWFAYAVGKYDKTYEFLPTDGVSFEGYGYWAYGMRALAAFINIADKFLGKGEYLEHNYIKYAADYAFYTTLPANSFDTPPLPSEIGIFNFGDAAPAQGSTAIGAVAFVSAAGQSGEGQWLVNRYMDFCISKSRAPSMEFFLYYDFSLAEENPAQGFPTARLFDDLGMVFLRSDLNGQGSGIAFRAGPVMGSKAALGSWIYDLGTGHSHSDVNHFMLYANNEWIFPDDGYVTNSTAQHNTLLVDGNGQYISGGIWSDLIRATPFIEKFAPGEDLDYVVANGTAAYAPSLGITLYRRHFIYIKPEILIIVDDIKTDTAKNLELRFHPNVQTAMQTGDSFSFVGEKNNYVINLFGEEGAQYTSELIWQHSNKSGGTVDKLTIRAINNTDAWTQATAISWADKSGAPEEINMREEGGRIIFTAEEQEYFLDTEELKAGIYKEADESELRVIYPISLFSQPVTEPINILDQNAGFTLNPGTNYFTAFSRAEKYKGWTIEGYGIELSESPDMTNVIACDSKLWLTKNGGFGILAYGDGLKGDIYYARTYVEYKNDTGKTTVYGDALPIIINEEEEN